MACTSTDTAGHGLHINRHSKSCPAHQQTQRVMACTSIDTAGHALHFNRHSRSWPASGRTRSPCCCQTSGMDPLARTAMHSRAAAQPGALAQAAAGAKALSAALTHTWAPVNGLGALPQSRWA